MSAGTKRTLVWSAILVLVVAGLWLAFSPRAVPVDLMTLAPGPMEVTVEAEGKTRIHDVYVLSAPVAGRVRRIEYHVGDPVVAGVTVLAEIEPGDPTLLDPRSEAQAVAAIEAAEAARAFAEAAVEEASAELDFARAELGRASELVVDGIISRRALEDAERSSRTRQAALATARAELQVRLFELEHARARLISPTDAQDSAADCACVPITSPVSGRILRIFEPSERVVTLAEPLLEIGEPTDLEVVVDFLSSDAVRIRPGQRAVLDGWGGDVPIAGRVRSVEPFGFTKTSALGIDEQRVNVILDFEGPSEQWERLGHGYLVETSVVLWEAEASLTVPLTAIFRIGEGWGVFREEGGRAKRTPIELGRRNGSVAEVLGGLAEGDTVVLHPGERIHEGALVTAREVESRS